MPPQRLNLEHVNRIALDYAFFKDSLREIASNYKIKQGCIPHYVRRAVKEELITKYQHKTAAKRRESAGRELSCDIELELKLIRAGKEIKEMTRQEFFKEKPEPITNRQISDILYNNYSISFKGKKPSRSYVSSFLRHYTPSKILKKREKMLESNGACYILFQTPEQNVLNGRKGAEITNIIRFGKPALVKMYRKI